MSRASVTVASVFLESKRADRSLASKEAGPVQNWSQEQVPISAEAQDLHGDPGTER